MVRSGRRRAATGWSGAALAVVLVATAPAGPMGSAAAGAAGAGVPAPPERAIALAGPGTIDLAWSASPGGEVASYQVAPVVGGVPCPSCAGVVSTTANSVVVALVAGQPTLRAVRAVGPGGDSTWVTAAPGTAPVPAVTVPSPLAGGETWAATPVAGQASSPLDTPPAGWTRTVGRDGGFSAPAGAGDLWVFADTTVVDSPATGNAATGPVDCFTRDGTAAMGSAAVPPRLDDALQPVTAAVAAGTSVCTGGPPPAGGTAPYQLLRPSPGTVPGGTCDNWVNGLANAAGAGVPPSATVEASYGANCFDGQGGFTGLGGTWTTAVTPDGAGQPVVLPQGTPGAPDLPPAACPATAFTSYNGGTVTSGNYGSLLADEGYDYFFLPYGNSTNAFAGLGVPEATCAAMALARVPATGTADPGAYQYLLPGGRWASPSATGEPAATLAAASADLLPVTFGGAYAGQVDVSSLAGGELVMVYVLPAPLLAPGGGTAVAAVRTATSPAGPWSAPALLRIPGFRWGADYQLNLHPEAATATTLPLSYVSVTTQGGHALRQLTFAELPLGALPQPGDPPAGAAAYRLAAGDGGVFSFGGARFYGSMGGQPLVAPIVGMAATPTGGGYWEVAADGGIFSFGAAFYGSIGGHPLARPIVGMAATPTGGGYWEVAADGGIFSFGDARFYGSMGGQPLVAPIVGMAATPTGGGYWEVAADGGIFSFGDARFYGSMGGQPLAAPIVGMAATPTGGGYWEVAADGGIFSFGAAFYGSIGGHPLARPIVGMAATPTGGGYWEVAADGGIFSFGDARFYGSMGGQPLVAPIVGMGP